MTTFSSLARSMDDLRREIERETGRIARLVATKALEEVVRRTPADEGTARSNYFVSLDEPIERTRTAFAPGKKLGLSETGNASAAIAAGARKIRDFNPRKNRSIVISNSLPYIGLLDEGSSTQAPSGFSEAAAMIAANEVEKFRLR